MRLALPALLLLLAVPAAAGSHGRPDGPVRERFDARGEAAPRTQLLFAPAGAPLTDPAPELAPERLARSFVEERLAPAGEMVLLGSSEGGGGVTFVALEQRFDGLPVALGRVEVAVRADGSVLAARVGELAPTGPPAKLLRSLRTPQAALARARRLAGDDSSSPLRTSLPEEAGPPAREVLLATATGALPAWRVRLADPQGSPFAQDVFVAAEDGRLLRREPAVFGAVSQARVWPQDPTQGSVFVSFPDPVTNPTVHSPLGWESSGTTEGNNVRAGLSHDGFVTDGPVAAASGDPLVLDFPYTGVPAADSDAALTNVFWALNTAHDRLRARGFTEAAGAFQQDSVGRGGVEGDRMIALVQYDSRGGTRPVNFTASGTDADGSFSWIAVGLFEVAGTGELRDAAFETDLLYHEYVHDAVTRLVGNDAACLGGVHPAALAEGWSDFLAASFTDDPVIGAWVADDPDAGLRRAALDENNFTLLQLCATGCDATNDGEIWSGALWDLRDDFIALHGPEAGVERVERLVVEGMRYTPCRPTFADARDGLLLADAALFGAEHHCLIWDAMLGRGIGQGTVIAGPDDELPTPGFGRPPECSGAASVAFEQGSYGVDADVVIEVLDGEPGPDPVALVTSPTGGTVEVPLEPVGSGLLLRGDLRIRPDAPAPGQLQVVAGESLTASYARAAEDARAAVSDAIAARVQRHEIWAAWCQRDDDDDHGDTPGWWVLPGFLDAGENADVYVTLASETAAPLEDLRVTVTSLSPDVGVLPSDEILVGTVPAAVPGAPRLFQFDFKAVADPGVSAGQVAEIRFDLVSRGRSGSVVLPLTLNMDYEVATGLSPFARGVETFEADSPSRELWEHRSYLGGPDDWRLEACAGAARSAGYGNVSPGCAPYTDDQGAPALISPPLFPDWPAETQAYRLNELSWSHHVELGTDPAERFCDLDLVAVFLTPDPASLPYEDPTNVYAYGPVAVYSFQNRSDGHVPAGPGDLETGPQLVDPAIPYPDFRVAWVLWNDIYPDYCGDPDAVGRYLLDDVAWTYDRVIAVPEATPCGARCVARIELEAVPPGPKCDGEEFVLDASGTQVEGCAGTLYFAFAGNGVPPEFGWTTESSAPAVGLDGGVYSVYVQCDTDPECNHYRAVRNLSPAPPAVGTTLPGSLRVAREGEDLRLTWLGAAAPPSYAVLGAAGRAELAAGPASWPLLAAVDDAEGPEGEGELVLAGAAASGPPLEYLLVLGRDRCTDEPRVP